MFGKDRVVCEVSGQPFILARAISERYRSLNVPLPRLCEEERYRRLLSFRNDRKFFWRTCDKTGEKIYSTYPPNAPFPVCSFEYWLEDPRDGTQYGQDYDPQVPFFTQLLWLWKSVTRPASTVRNLVAAMIEHPLFGASGSSFVFSGQRVQDCHYCYDVRDARHCMDCYRISSCEQCYECIDCVDCRLLRWAEHCRNCTDSWFISNCENCHHCLFSTNLSGKSYYVCNESVSKERYEEVLAEQALHVRLRAEEAIEEYAVFLRNYPIPHIYADNASSCSGNYLRACSDVIDCYECSNVTNSAYCFNLNDAEACLDGLGFGEGLSTAVNFVSVGMHAKNIFNCVECHTNISDLSFCLHCENSSHLFGCVGMRGAEYCILNKRYSRQEYERLRNDIEAVMEARSEWGKMLPPGLCDFPYNHSMASDYFPLSKVQAVMMGYRWDDEHDGVRPSQLLYGDAPGERFAEVPAVVSEETRQQLLDRIFVCEMSGAPFKFSLHDINLYQVLGVPPPARAFEQRHQDRLRKLSPRKIIERPSDKTGKAIRTAFPVNWRQPVFECKEWAKTVEKN